MHGVVCHLSLKAFLKLIFNGPVVFNASFHPKGRVVDNSLVSLTCMMEVYALLWFTLLKYSCTSRTRSLHWGLSDTSAVCLLGSVGKRQEVSSEGFTVISCC